MAVGNNALYTQSFSNGGVAWNSDNVALGFEALYSNQPTSTTNGIYNTALGNEALRANTTGHFNTASGYQTLYNNTTASRNVAMGNAALFTQSFSNGNVAWNSSNVAVGFAALYANQPTSNTNGIYNNALGNEALRFNTTGSNNTASGYQALYSNTTGSNNTASGNQALYSNTTASRNVAVGNSALKNQSFSNGGVAWNSDNVAVGFEALYWNQPTADLNGFQNTALGTRAMELQHEGLRERRHWLCQRLVPTRVAV